MNPTVLLQRAGVNGVTGLCVEQGFESHDVGSELPGKRSCSSGVASQILRLENTK